jgi:hypothetical protein
MSRPDGVAPATWRVVLSDWYNCSALVTITLKSGVQMTGKVDQHPTKWLHDMGTLTERNGTIHNIDLTEVAAITARAT